MLLKEELALVVRAQNGDRSALGDLWDSITPKLHGYLVNTVRDQQLAEDLLQNTWLKAIGAISQFKAKGVRFSAWLFAIARNECRQHWRRPGKPELPLQENDENEVQVLDKKDFTQTIFLDHLLDQLPHDDQDILRLRYISDFSFKEIARILHIPPITAHVRVHRALGRARANLAN